MERNADEKNRLTTPASVSKPAPMLTVKVNEATLERVKATAADFDQKVNEALTTAAQASESMTAEQSQINSRFEARFGELETTIRNIEATVAQLASVKPPDANAQAQQMASIAAEAASKAVTSILAKAGQNAINAQTAEAEGAETPQTPAEAFEASVEAHKAAGKKPADALRAAINENEAGYQAWKQAIQSGSIKPKSHF